MKKLIPAIIAILIIPFAIACKKGTNSTGTVTNGVAYFTITNISPAVTGSIGGYHSVNAYVNGQNTPTDLPIGATSYTSDNFTVTEGQNFCVAMATGMSQCTSLTCTIYYNGTSIKSKSFVIGPSCTNGSNTSLCEIAK
jgi:hypothetical protein